MRAIQYLSRGLVTLLVAAAAHAQSPRVVLFEDPQLGADRLHYPLLISGGRGYRIQCTGQDEEEAVIRGLGFTTVPAQILTAVDPEVVAADPAANPLLCPSGDRYPIQVFASDGPEGRVYYLQFPAAFGSSAFTDRLYVPRCAGLVAALKLDLEQARVADPTPFFQGKIHEIPCLSGNAPFGAPPESFAEWCVKGDRTAAETATVDAILQATPVGTTALGNPTACTDADQFLRSVQTLNLNGKGVQSLAPLSVLGHLTSLSLVGNQVTDLAPLSKLRALTFLDLSHNQIASVVALAPLTTLTRLDLSDNQIQDVRFLSA
ncbi:MAG: leucine-rich repeat domain-containing protein, partial [Thermoanaerobaculia bacterium]|nr:leucine-rich repeat domain-containing protein [Thermoanaerobaculia bacterium]